MSILNQAGTAFTILATSLALAAVSGNLGLQKRADDLEKAVGLLRQEMAALDDLLGDPDGSSTATPQGGNASQNVFFAGKRTQITLDQAVLGAPAPGELDGYDEVFPAVLAYGTVAVRGTGRLVLDGDASDVVLKIDNTYFSLRELFGFGSTLSFDPRPPPPPPPDTPRIRDLCTSTDLLTGEESNCAYRRNWGVDACFTAEEGAQEQNNMPICVCGGGWQSLSRVVRVRHFVSHGSGSSSKEARQFFSNAFFSRASLCCSPMASLNEAACLLTANSSAAAGGFSGAWLDTALRCDNTADRLCDARDRADYIGLYEACVGLAGVELETCLAAARNRVNAHPWAATRDYRFNNGQWYAIQLTEDVERACTGLRLTLQHAHGYIDGFPAAFECGQGSRIWFEVAPTPNSESPKRGSEYYVLTHERRHSGWYCLSGALSAANVSHYVGEAPAFAEDQLAWLPYPQAKPLCQKAYLGKRELFGFGQGPPVGIYLDKENNYARAIANVDFTILPYT